MKKLFFAFASLALLSTSCVKDEIEVVNDNNSGNGNGGGVIDDDPIVTDGYDVTVNIVFSNSGNATVNGLVDSITATTSGNDVTLTNISQKKVMYNLSGTTSNGFLKIYSGRKQGLTLNSVNITNTRGAAINIQGLAETPNKGKRVDVVLNGSNTLADGSNYSLTPSTEDEKGVIFSEGQLIFSGNGTLNVTASGKGGIVTDDYLRFAEGVTINVTSSAGHGVRGKDYILVSSGTINVNVSANGKKGFSSDSLVRFDGGVTTIAVTGNAVVEDGDTNVAAGIKADKLFEMMGGSLTITSSGTGGKGINCDGEGYFRGGTVKVTVTGSNYGTSGGGPGGGGPGGGPGGGGPGGNNNSNSKGAKGIKFTGDLFFSGSTVISSASNHEAIESKSNIEISDGYIYAYSSDDAINTSANLSISGGYVCAHSTGNDGLDANGDMYLSGGLIYAIGTQSPEEGIDVNINEGGQHHELVISGGTIIAIGGISNGFTRSQSCYRATSWSKNAWYSMTIGDNTIAFKTPSSGGSGMVLSASSTPTLKSGVTVNSGTEVLNGMVQLNATYSGGNNVSVSSY